jgi:hypothetical protein
VAINSPNREIRAVALEMAKRTSIYAQKQGARLSPTLILILNIILCITVGLVGWYAFLHYTERLAYEVTTIAFLLYLVIVAVSLFLSGFLSQANFMKFINSVLSRWKTLDWSNKKASDREPTDSISSKK